jgi:hypothetical protein
MKFKELIFDEYIQDNTRINLHAKLKVCDKLSEDISKIPNMILYGPSGTGKYTQSLNLIKKYSDSKLKYEKKMTLQINKQSYTIKLSDIHYEVDFSLLGCNARVTWHDVYQQIVDAISAKQNKTGIILCKNFHTINGELLELFYSYIQNIKTNVIIKFILITEQLSFIPNNIVDSFEIITIARPTKTSYGNCLKIKMSSVVLNDVTNIKGIENCSVSNHIHCCNKIISMITNEDNIKFTLLRDYLYDMLIMDLNISECIWYILRSLIISKHIKDDDISPILLQVYIVLQRYNNNYRPIMHLESFIFTLINAIHGYSNSSSNLTITS